MGQKIEKGFYVKLDGIELSEAVQQRIQLGIQEVILRELAAHRPSGENGSGGGYAYIIPKEWRGLIMKQLRQADVEAVGLNTKLNEKTFATF